MKLEKLFDIILKDKPSIYIKQNEKEMFDLIPSLSMCKGFEQNSIWHVYDVYEHILHVIDGVPNVLELRLAALFHDLGKPFVYTEDEDGNGHFFGHWDKSKEIFDEFASRYHLESSIKERVSNLILYHDLNVGKMNDDELDKLVNVFDENGIKMLFQLKRSDLLAQNKKFHYLLEDYDKQEARVLMKIR